MLMMDQRGLFLLEHLAPKVLRMLLMPLPLPLEMLPLPLPLGMLVPMGVVETEVAEMAVEVPQVLLGPVTENERVA
jgi:hypothetical protein